MRPSQRDAAWPSGNAWTCWGTARGFTLERLESGIEQCLRARGERGGLDLHLFFQESQHRDGRRGTPVLRSQVTPPQLPLHSGHSSGPDSEAQSHLRPHGSPAWKPRCPCSAPGWGGWAGRGGLVPSPPPLSDQGCPHDAEQARSHPEIPAGEHTRVGAHVRTHRLTHATHADTPRHSAAPQHGHRPLQTLLLVREEPPGAGLGPPPDLAGGLASGRRAGGGPAQARTSREEPGRLQSL